jgi:hypothetical protein
MARAEELKKKIETNKEVECTEKKGKKAITERDK